MCDQGCEKSEIRHGGSSSSSSSSSDTVWLEPESKSSSCGKCRKPRNHCKCRFPNVTILPYLPPGAIPIGCGPKHGGQGYCPPPQNCHNVYPPYCPTPPNCEPFEGKISMQVPVNPTENLVGLDSGLNNGYIMIQMRCLPNGVVAFQWEPFECQVGANNIKQVTMNFTQGILPIYTTDYPIRVELNGDTHVGYLRVKNVNGPQIFQFHFSNSGDTSGKIGDSLKIHGGSVTWIRC